MNVFILEIVVLRKFQFIKYFCLPFYKIAIFINAVHIPERKKNNRDAIN